MSTTTTSTSVGNVADFALAQPYVASDVVDDFTVSDEQFAAAVGTEQKVVKGVLGVTALASKMRPKTEQPNNMGRYWFIHGGIVDMLSAPSQEVYQKIIELPYAEKIGIMRALMLGKAYILDSPITAELSEIMCAIPAADRKDPFDIVGPLVDTPLMRTQSRSDYIVRGLYGSKTKVAIVDFGLVVFHKNQNVAFCYHEEKECLEQFISKYQDHHDIISKVRERMVHLDLNHRVDGSFMKVAPKKISEEQFQNQGRAGKKRMFTGTNAAVLLGGVQFLPFGSFQVPIESGAAFSIRSFPDLAGLDALRAVSIYVALLAQPGGVQAINEVVKSFLSMKASNTLTSEVVLGYFRDCLHFGRVAQPQGGTIMPASVVKSFWDSNSKPLLNFLAKDKGAIHAIGSVVAPFGCETVSVGDAYFHLTTAGTRAKASWRVYNGMGLASSLKLKVAAHDSIEGIDKRGKNVVFDGGHQQASLFTPRVMNIQYSNQGDDCPVILTNSATCNLGNSVVDLNFDARAFVIIGEAKLTTMLNKGNSNIDVLVHDLPVGVYKGPSLLDSKGAAAFENFIVVFPIRYIDKFQAIGAAYDLRFVFASVNLLFSVVVVGTKRDAPSVIPVDYKKIAAELWTLAYTRLYVINRFYTGVVDDVGVICHQQHVNAASSLYVNHLMKIDNPENVLSSYKRGPGEKEATIKMELGTSSRIEFTTIGGFKSLNDDISDDWSITPENPTDIAVVTPKDSIVIAK